MPSSQRENFTVFIKDKRGRVLSVGKNNYGKTHPLMFKLGKKHNLEEKVFLHAEVDAIIKCPNLDRAYTIEVYRINSQGKYMPSKPCPICRSAIESTTIKQILYMDTNHQFQLEKL